MFMKFEKLAETSNQEEDTHIEPRRDNERSEKINPGQEGERKSITSVKVIEKYNEKYDEDKQTNEPLENHELEKKYDKHMDIAYVLNKLLPELIIEKDGDEIIIKDRRD